MKNYTDFAPLQEEISNITNKYEQFFFLKSYKCITISSLKKCTPRDRKMNIRFSGSKWALRGKMNQLHCQLQYTLLSFLLRNNVQYSMPVFSSMQCSAWIWMTNPGGRRRPTGDHIINQSNQPLCIINHRRRIKTEETAKVVAAGWRTEFSQFLATLAVLHQDDLKNRMHQDDLKTRMNSPYSSKSSKCKIASSN